jgi:hypothetical protein
VSREVVGHKLLDILGFASPTSYTLTSFRFSLLK